MSRSKRCLLVYPEFTNQSFWNFRTVCELRGAKYPTAPLGLITVAALLPADWEIRLVDCNVQSLADADLDWADLVLTGGMFPQKVSVRQIITRTKSRGKTVVVGGPDATSSPQRFEAADYLVLGEAEITLPRWLADFEQGRAQRIYEPGEQRADVSTSPVPRFDLLKPSMYNHLGIQFARGCPFLCEFCDIIELFGRVPRLKSPEQLIGELDALYSLGYRGHVDFVDDNFIGNKRDVKKFLPRLIAWQQAHDWPFEFTTEASINLADDDGLLEMMQQASFCGIFVGIESPDEDTLRQMQKAQNTRRQLADSLHKIYSYGIYVTTGYIVGFDAEQGTVAQGMIDLIEASDAPVNMVGLLYALPGTQLTRRLAREGRLAEQFDQVWEEVHAGDQCGYGLNFTTLRPRGEILSDYRRIIAETYAATNYFDRVRRLSLALNCSKRQFKQSTSGLLRDIRAFARMVWRMGLKGPVRRLFWRTLFQVLWQNPKSVRYALTMIALYLHLGPFSKFVLQQMDAALLEEASKRSEAVVVASQLGVTDSPLHCA
jgi:radical SAM superfamily enzyme YgiQ (UPF0313 family)